MVLWQDSHIDDYWCICTIASAKNNLSNIDVQFASAISDLSKGSLQHTSQNLNWLVVSTHLKNISQNGNLPQIGVNIKNIWNHYLVKLLLPFLRFWMEIFG